MLLAVIFLSDWHPSPRHSIPKGKKLIDDMWLYTALAMIGENFEAGEELCGAVIRCARRASLLVAC